MSFINYMGKVKFRNKLKVKAASGLRSYEKHKFNLRIITEIVGGCWTYRGERARGENASGRNSW